MLKEVKGMEYVLVILRLLDKNPGERDSKEVYSLLVGDGVIRDVSLSYLQKVLPRMVRVGLLRSSENGYVLGRVVSDISLGDVLGFCDAIEGDSPLFKLYLNIMGSAEGVSVRDCF